MESFLIFAGKKAHTNVKGKQAKKTSPRSTFRIFVSDIQLLSFSLSEKNNPVCSAYKSILSNSSKETAESRSPPVSLRNVPLK